MSKLNKLYIAIQLVLIWAIVFTIPNSLLLQIVLSINLLYTIYTLSFTEIVNDDFIELEFTVKKLQQSITNEMMRLDAVVDELETLGKKETAKKTKTDKATKSTEKKVAKIAKKATAKKPAVKTTTKKAVKKK